MSLESNVIRNIRILRGLLGMSQGDLAERVGLSRVTVTKIESGKRRLLVEELERFSQALDVPFELLLKAEVRLTSSDALG